MALVLAFGVITADKVLNLVFTRVIYFFRIIRCVRVVLCVVFLVIYCYDLVFILYISFQLDI